MVSSDSYLSVLNPEQKQAVMHSGSPLLILAGAGSGKTRVITTKIAWLIGEQGVDPHSILAVTFTKKAANEMRERACRLNENAQFAQIRTFHSFCSWFLRVHAEYVGLPRTFTVYDDDDMMTLLGKAAPELNRVQRAQCARSISRAKDYCLDPDSSDLDQIDADPEFPRVYALYQARLRETGNVDFGDLIMLSVKLLQADEAIRLHMQNRFRVIMVDEYQDSNVAQFELLKLLSGNGNYVCVVGDDDQSIYSFRGAEVKNILTFRESFPGAELIKLERNYRSVSPILSAADQVVQCNSERLGKTLRAERGTGKKPTLVFLANQDEETGFCAEMISQAHKKGCPYADWAILYRTNAQSLGFETEFMNKKIPYHVVGSLKFYDREEIKDVLAYLSLILNPRDEINFARIVNKPPRGVGAVTQDKIIAYARSLYEKSAFTGVEGADTADASMAGDMRGADDALNKDDATIEGGLFSLLQPESVSSVESTEPIDRIDRENPSEKTAPFAEGMPQNGQKSQSVQQSVPQNEPSLLRACIEMLPHVSKKAREGLQTFIDVMQTLNDILSTGEEATLKKGISTETLALDALNGKAEALAAPEKTLTAFIEKLIKITGLSEYHTAQDEISGTQRNANMQELANSAFLYQKNRDGLTLFLDHIELDRAVSGQEEEADAVTLITLHNTKGLEFPRVIITGIERGVFPREDKTGDSLEEERRLFYVGITRARDELYLTTCGMRRLYGKSSWMEPSPFLKEINLDSIDIIGKKPASFTRNQSRLGAGTPNGGFDGVPSKEDRLAGRWKIGTRLYHDDYGYGVISKTAYMEDDYVITVAFETGTQKRFMPAYQASRLMIITDE